VTAQTVAVGLAPRTLPSPTTSRPEAARPWLRTYANTLLLLDLLMVAVTVLLTAAMTPAGSPFGELPWPEPAAAAFAGLGWMLSLGTCRAYEQRYLGSGSDEYKRVFTASVRLVVGLVVMSYALQLPTSRAALLMLFVVGGPALVAERYVARQVLHRMRRSGRCLQRVVVVGSRREVTELMVRVGRDRHAGFQVVGVCLAKTGSKQPLPDFGVPVLGGPDDVVAALEAVHADTVAVAGSHAYDSAGLRQLAWQIEGTGVDLVVSPMITDVAGPRIHIRPVAGLPLLHVEEPDFAGARRWLKIALERVAAALLLLVSLPFTLAAAAAIKLTSEGPIFYSQVRVGLRGQEFRIWKFRTMVVDADAHLRALAEQNEADGALFKLRRDPRITSVGRWLRRYSIDELPQLWNVVSGSMALIGPRPPLPAEVQMYGDDARRRLLVKPGLTGLWQVSGRSDLSWEETVRLDLHYVENWSPVLDLMILWKTFSAVVAGRGAY
jgi:exopolysaccharide biosynthesis polyprenyl glycosylphosphotransferase